MKHHRLGTDDKALLFQAVASQSKSGSSCHSRWALLGIAAAILAGITVIAAKTPTLAGAGRPHSVSGAMSPWEKTAGPPGIQINVIFEANNVVYAGTQTQGVYKSTDNGSNWAPANTGIERASISDIIASGPNLLAAAKSECSTYLNIFKSTDNGASWSGTSGLTGK